MSATKPFARTCGSSPNSTGVCMNAHSPRNPARIRLHSSHVRVANTPSNQAMQASRTTVVFKAGWKDGALAIVDGMLAIAQGKDPTASCAKANDALGKVVK